MEGKSRTKKIKNFHRCWLSPVNKQTENFGEKKASKYFHSHLDASAQENITRQISSNFSYSKGRLRHRIESDQVWQWPSVSFVKNPPPDFAPIVTEKFRFAEKTIWASTDPRTSVAADPSSSKNLKMLEGQLGSLLSFILANLIWDRKRYFEGSCS